MENTQRLLDEVASKAKAEHANTSLAGVASGSMQAGISALHAMRLEVKELKAALEPEELAEQGRQAAKKEESPMAGTVASSSAPGTGGRVASEAVLIAGPPPMAAPDWAPDAEDEMAKQKIIIRKFKTKKIGQGDWKLPANLRIDFQCFAGGDCAIEGSKGKVSWGGQRENSSIGRESKSTTRSNGV